MPTWASHVLLPTIRFQGKGLSSQMAPEMGTQIHVENTGTKTHFQVHAMQNFAGIRNCIDFHFQERND